MVEMMYEFCLIVCLVNWIGGTHVYRTKENEQRCQELGKEPYFEPELVVDQTWRIYYTWHMKLGETCMDFQFKMSEPSMVKKIYDDMHAYVEDEPEWSAAVLMMTMGKANREMLLLNDQGAAGRLVAVPDIVRDGNIAPMKKSVPLVKFQMKLLDKENYLVVMDCQVGVATLAARVKDGPYTPTQIELAAKKVFNILDVGEHACSQDLQDFHKSDNETDVRFKYYNEN